VTDTGAGPVNGVTLTRSDQFQQISVPPNTVNTAIGQIPVLPVAFVQPVPGLSGMPITSVPLQLAGVQHVIPLQQGVNAVQDFRNEIGKNLQLLKICH